MKTNNDRKKENTRHTKILLRIVVVAFLILILCFAIIISNVLKQNDSAKEANSTLEADNVIKADEESAKQNTSSSSEEDVVAHNNERKTPSKTVSQDGDKVPAKEGKRGILSDNQLSGDSFGVLAKKVEEIEEATPTPTPSPTSTPKPTATPTPSATPIPTSTPTPRPNVVLPKSDTKLGKDFDTRGKETVVYINVDGIKNVPVLKKWKNAMVTDGVAEYLDYLKSMGFKVKILNTNKKSPYKGYTYYETNFEVSKE